MGPMQQPQVRETEWSTGTMIVGKEKPKYWKKTCPSLALSITNPIILHIKCYTPSYNDLFRYSHQIIHKTVTVVSPFTKNAAYFFRDKFKPAQLIVK
jgi:hypothetical protein